MKAFLPYLLSCMLLAGCLPEDERINPRAPGDISTASVTMGSDYRTQVYYDLGTQAVVGTADKMDWDLALDADVSGSAIWLNPGRLMLAAPTGTSDIALVPALGSLAFRPDGADGLAAHTALAGWAQSPGQVWVIDRGYTVDGLPMDPVKVRFIRVDSVAYHLEWAPLSAPAATIRLTVPKRPGYNRVYLRLDAPGRIVDIEPAQADWDIQFTQYTERLFDGNDTIPYLVTGVLLNPYGVLAAVDSLVAFADIDRATAQAMPLVGLGNVIGYAWKAYNFDSGTFEVDATKTYVIQSTEGLHFKLRFTDFYAPDGQKGSPTFEFQRL